MIVPWGKIVRNDKSDDLIEIKVLYREYDLAHLKLVFEFSIYKVWKSVEYGVSNELDTAYWGFLRVGTTFAIFQNIILIPYLEYSVLSPLDTRRSSLDILSGSFIGCMERHGYGRIFIRWDNGVLVFRTVIFKYLH
ncbi:hypothetical protein Tco_0086863 [Tanacetum coccineum]